MPDEKRPYALGYVSGDYMASMFVDSVHRLIYRDFPPVIRGYSGAPVHGARSKLAMTFLKSNASDRLLMLDTDIAFSLDDVDRLLAHDEPVVSGVYPLLNSWNNDAKIVADGCGFLLVHRSVFETLQPYPFNPVKTNTGEVTGEDVGFRLQAKAAGFEICVDDDIRVKHVKAVTLDVAQGTEIDRTEYAAKWEESLDYIASGEIEVEK